MNDYYEPECGSYSCSYCFHELYDPSWDIVWPGGWVTLNGELITFDMLDELAEVKS
jgi:hypothetical protein